MERIVLSQLAVLVAILSFLSFANADANPAYVCSFCVIAFGLVEQSAFQVHLLPYLEEKCGENRACKSAVDILVLKAESGLVPEEICRSAELCTDTCTVYSKWPVIPLPDEPIDWPIERRQLNSNDAVKPDFTLLKGIFAELIQTVRSVDADTANKVPFMGVITAALGVLQGDIRKEKFSTPQKKLQQDYEPCSPNNISCHLINFVDGHLPLVDSDGDRFAPPEAKRLRGSDWRGADCNDELKDVYPGRKASSYDPSVDHNCNGISGGNETVASYEELFCSNSEQRGIIILGDSATAHFHIPPQWLTAQGWNMDQLLPDAANELDQPHCSWGTGHATPEECPYQSPVPGVENEVISLYTQLRNRNRCNHNDFQNIGVNGARITSSMKLVDSVGRDIEMDHPVLAWLALIGNDVCNGHPGYDHMTTPDEFYSHAMESLTALDATLPAGSHVVALGLFDGELLYSTMHSHQHPLGCSYDDLYDFMNCEEENPCWGWLNTDREVRLNTTKISNSLNDVYQNISDTQEFKNFKFIFYDPDWLTLFSDYQAAGYPLTNLIEPSDGFHPSQAGNALFAQKFFAWLETNHPETLGPVNPYNDEIDKLFFQ